ncbi:hypothetical protein H4219_001348 [Mycoemilia scoparia]|uniref:Uncharacterized protein n=1 Tax=Mycoemilia scoparia TaxID=417184 RepID=A0A9W8A174_9FUNG|nr:hypothetical protein H4219_001348 [Mycoemilia scoparia]
MATNGILGGTGDVLAQYIDQRRQNSRFIDNYDWKRTLRFVTWGAMCAPVLNKWYIYLNRRFPIPQKPATILASSMSVPPGKIHAIESNSQQLRLVAAAVGKRVAADQIIYAPIGLVAFFGAMTAMETKGLEEFQEKMKEKYVSTLIANYAVWPAVQTINFTIVPTIFRVPFVSVVSVFWNALLSWINSSPPKSPAFKQAIPMYSDGKNEKKALNRPMPISEKKTSESHSANDGQKSNHSHANSGQ